MIPLSIQRENDLLARELGYEEGHPRYQWALSDWLRMPMILMDDLNKVIYDYFCACGKNVSVHSATCRWTTARPKWEMRSLVPDLAGQWVLCRWLKPEASRDEWESVFGGVPYPSGGYLAPVGDPQKCIAVSPGQAPYRQTTEMCIAAIKEHFQKTGKQYSDETRDKWAENEAKLREELRLKCIDRFPVHEGFPGEKHGWSHGGDPTVESPNVRKIITPSEATN